MSLFGTDGIRAKAFEYPLVPSFISRLGPAFREIVPPGGRLVVFARDTRLSGSMILKHLVKGFKSAGFQTMDAGVLPTPSLAFLVPHWKAALGCMISASHNPPEFNGIKFFGSTGGKIPRSWEEKAEAILQQGKTPGKNGLKSGGPLIDMRVKAQRAYIDFLRSSVPADMDFRGLRIAVDGAEGAAGAVLPEVLESLGAEVRMIYCAGRGARINTGCGALHPGDMAALVRSARCDIGFALDGDGDRLMVADETGKVFPGESILAAVALERRRLSEPGSSMLATTVVSNFALKKFLELKGVQVVETPVGDRWVLEELKKRGLGFGGENSGHFIWAHLLPSADACLGALQILQMLKRGGLKASRGIVRFALFPNAARQVPAPHKPPLEQLPRLQSVLGQVKKTLDGNGRVLVRYSGTEPVLRILLEGKAGRGRLEALASKLEQAFLEDIKR